MPDDHEAIEGLSGDQLAERAKALLLEAEYWQLVLDDCRSINDGLLEVSTQVIESTSALILIVGAVGPDQVALVDPVLRANRAAQDGLLTVAAGLERVLELAEGRAKAIEPVIAALRSAAGVNDDDDDDQGDDDAA